MADELYSLPRTALDPAEATAELFAGAGLVSEPDESGRSELDRLRREAANARTACDEAQQRVHDLER